MDSNKTFNLSNGYTNILVYYYKYYLKMCINNEELELTKSNSVRIS